MAEYLTPFKCSDFAIHAECEARPHIEPCYLDGSQCGDKDCDCHRRWAEENGWI